MTALMELYLAHSHHNTNFLYQVAGACMVAARDIINEDPGTENHANRIIWANAARINPDGAAITMLISVLDNATIAADVANATDNDVQFVVNSLINTFANGE